MLYTTDLTLWNMYLRTGLAINTGRLIASIVPQSIDELQQSVVFNEDCCNDCDCFSLIWNKSTKQALDKMFDYLVEHEVPATKALLISESAYSFHKWLGFYNFDLARLIKDNQRGIAIEPKSKKKVVGNLKQNPKTIIKDGKVNCKWEVHIIKEV